jgi:hypothetical protein
LRGNSEDHQARYIEAAVQGVVIFHLPPQRESASRTEIQLTWPERKSKANRDMTNRPDTTITEMTRRQSHAALTPNNRYLSFLLSRYADPFTRVQYPQIFGPDAKAD